MIDLWNKLTGRERSQPQQDRPAQHHIAAAALLVEAGLMDGSFEHIEHDHIHRLLEDRFELTKEEAKALLEHAEVAAKQSVEWQGFTKTIKDAFDHEQRIELVEMLWQVVLADGELHDYEASLMRRITGLLYVSGRESADARNRARAAIAKL